MWFAVAGLASLMLMASGPENARTASHQPERTVHLTSSFAGRLPEPPTSEVGVGDPAPNFSFEGYDGHVMRLHHLLDQGPVLLVFGARESELRRMQQERGALLDLGIVPVAIVDSKPGATRATVKRLGLQYTVLADSRGVIADQFNVLDDQRVIPSWFVLDGRGRVRGMARGGQPALDYTRLCARALALPMPGVAFPSSH